MIDHISNYLHFEEESSSKRKIDDNSQIAITESGSRIIRAETSKGRIFQLFLNKEEYLKVKNSDIEGIWRAHFYGGNSIYLPPSSNLIISICKLLNFKNESV